MYVCTYIHAHIHTYVYTCTSALHKAGKQGGQPCYFSKRHDMRPALKIIKFKIIID